MMSYRDLDTLRDLPEGVRHADVEHLDAVHEWGLERLVPWTFVWFPARKAFTPASCEVAISSAVIACDMSSSDPG
jgi:hypothetical protein